MGNGGLFGGGPGKRFTIEPFNPKAAREYDKGFMAGLPKLGPVDEVEALEEFGDFVTALSEELAQRDRNSWQLGKIAAAFEIKLGRRTDEDRDNEVPTLADLAREAGCSIARLSEWRNNYLYWPDKSRALVTYPGLTWSHYNLCRRHFNGDPARQELARAFLKIASDRHMPSDLFGDWLANRRFYPPEILTAKKYVDLDDIHFTIARKASGGSLENAVELLDDAILKLLIDLKQFESYCRQVSAPLPAPMPDGPAYTMPIPDSVTFAGEYYDVLRDLLPSDIEAGDEIIITIRRKAR